ncbi:MAG: hypothetical protein ACRESS_06185 [Stenotrophobium sp.]
MTGDSQLHLIQAGIDLAEKLDYADATLGRVAAAAGVPVATLEKQYVDFTHYLIAVQQFLLNEQRTDMIAASTGIPPGLERIRISTTTFLDTCLRRLAVRKWLMQARRDEDLVAEGLRRQTHSFALIVSTEFHALGWPYPLAAAHLYLAAIQEAARTEQSAGKPVKAVREAIWKIASTYIEPAAVKPAARKRAAAKRAAPKKR